MEAGWDKLWREVTRPLFPSKSLGGKFGRPILVVRGERDARLHLPRQLTFALGIQAPQQVVKLPGERLREDQRISQARGHRERMNEGVIPMLVRLTRRSHKTVQQ